MAKAWKIEGLDYNEDLLTSLSRILDTRYMEMLSYEEGAKKGDDIEFVHSMRVSSRRLQAVMKIFRNAYPEVQYRRQYSMIREVKNYLGVVRHYDVFITMLEKYRDTLPENERKAVNLMMIHQNSIRFTARKELIKKLKEMDKAGCRDSFSKFISKLSKANEKKVHGKARKKLT